MLGSVLGCRVHRVSMLGSVLGVQGVLVVYPVGWDRPPAHHSLPGGLQGYWVSRGKY